MAQNLQYTPASFAIPAMNSTTRVHVSSQQLTSPQQGRDRPRAPRQDPATTTKTTPVQVHPAYKPPPTMSSTPVQVRPAYKPPPTMGSTPVRVHPAYKPPPQKPSLVQVDAESFTRLVQQVQSQQATINSLVARIDILEQSRFSYFDRGANTITSSGEDSDDAYDSDASNSPIQQLLTKINCTQEQQQQNQEQALQQAQQNAQQQIQPRPQQTSQQVQAPRPRWAPSNYVNPIPPPDQVPDMAGPPEGLKFEFALTIVNGREYVAGGSQGATMVLNAWTGPHGYRVFARRSTIVEERYSLTMCCAWMLDKERPPRVKEEPLTDGEQASEGNRRFRKRNNYKYACPFRFCMRQVDKDSGLFEVRSIRSGVAAPHNHDPDPHAMVPFQLRGFQVLIR
ncbi:hypothetical protein V8F33_010493 [Rhypophila sp. PSN 637]